MPTDQYAERRRTSRVNLKVPVIISGVDVNGFNFAEETETATVSKDGAAVRTMYNLALGREISVRTKGKNRVGQFEVVWIGKPGTPSEGKVGLEWLEPRRFWGIEFPPADWEKTSG